MDWWSLCCLCQGGTNDNMHCPANKECFNSVYDIPEKDLLDFDSINDLPDYKSHKCVNDGSGIAKTLLASK